MEHYILDADGNPVLEPDLLAWARWYEDSDEARVVRATEIGPALVSTVFLGTDHGWARLSDPNRPPVLWETMAFDLPEGIAFEEGHQRYTSRKQAVAGHNRMVARLRRALGVSAT